MRGEKRPTKADSQITKGNVYLDGHPICDDGWTHEDAIVACRFNQPLLLLSLGVLTLFRMLGYGIAIPEPGSPYGLANVGDKFQYTEISCKGDERNLLDCSLK